MPSNAFIMWKRKKNETEKFEAHLLHRLFPFKMISHVSVGTVAIAFLPVRRQYSKGSWEMGVIYIH